jgi:hypothetical protein
MASESANNPTVIHEEKAMGKTTAIRWIRPAAVLIGLMILPVGVKREMSEERVPKIELGVNEACGQGETGTCCFLIGEVCDEFPNAPQNHRYYISGDCP